MQGIEQAYADAAFGGLRQANTQLREASLGDVVSAATQYGKGDTFKLDAIPEIAIDDVLKRCDRRTVLVTEELGGQLPKWIKRGGSLPTMFFCDPTDRSAPLEKILRDRSQKNPSWKVGDVLNKDLIPEWEERFGKPARITGATSAITCVREGLPIFTIILNYITQQVLLACNAGIKMLQLPDHTTGRYKNLTVSDILNNGRTMNFPPIGNRNHGACQRFATFLGKRGYRENFNDSRIFADGENREPVYDIPGGPSRSLYLSDLYEQPLGFILANGEKITEWIHWLPVVRFAHHAGEPSLKLFEICHERPWTREGVNMAPSEIYSIFRPWGDEERGKVWIDVQPLRTFKRPSAYRETLVVAPTDNTWLLQTMRSGNHRQLEFSSAR